MANRWIVYTLLILLRFYGACYHSLPGYIHPDEFFQGGQELFFGCQQRRTKKPILSELNNNNIAEHTDNNSFKYVVDNIPWEFEPKNAIRSIVPPAFMTLLPLRVYSLLRSMFISFVEDRIDCPSSVDNDIPDKSTFISHHQLSGREILITPRLFMTILSYFFLDGCLWMLVKYNPNSKGQSSEKESGPPIEVLVLASSWPMLAMATRPFTNTLEAMVVSIVLLIVAVDHPKHDASSRTKNQTSQIQHREHSAILILLGIACSIGLFVRFTFAFFAMPIVLLFLYNRWRAYGNKNWKKFGLVLLRLALSFITTSLLFVIIDWYYYHYISPGRDSASILCNNWSCYRDEFKATATKYIVPWNAFRYNSKATNLAEHGLHPRITHALVNMPMLYGPLSLAGYYSCIRKRGNVSSSAENCYQRVLCQSTIMSGLLVLSCAPHQEPRFLLPCIVPLVFLYGRSVVGMESKQSTLKKRVFLVVWLAFNSILYLFFGWLHQGGMVSSLIELPLPLNFHNKVPETVIYYKTYMPPTFLSRGRLLSSSDEEDCNSCNASDEERIVYGESQISLVCENQAIIDLQGREVEVLMEVLKEKLVCNQTTKESVLLITPAPVMISLADYNWREFTFASVDRHYPHVSTEDWPVMLGTSTGFIDQLELVTHRVSCAAEL